MKRILFVCIENSCRSQIAEAFAKMHGRGSVEVFSAGSHASGRVHPKAIESMRECGYDLTQHYSKSLQEIPDLEFDYAITMGCGDSCPMVRAKHREAWEIPNPTVLSPEGFGKVRDLIESKVKELLQK